MALPSQIATQTITRLRGTTTTDAHHNTTTSWSNPNSLVITGCSVQPVVGSENLDGRNAVTSRWQVFAPYDADILPTDRIVHASIAYEVDGPVLSWVDPTVNGLDRKQALDHKQAQLKRVDG